MEPEIRLIVMSPDRADEALELALMARWVLLRGAVLDGAIAWLVITPPGPGRRAAG
jgi:hypothetical protein